MRVGEKRQLIESNRWVAFALTLMGFAFVYKKIKFSQPLLLLLPTSIEDS